MEIFFNWGNTRDRERKVDKKKQNFLVFKYWEREREREVFLITDGQVEN